jgi:hypothetical protein
MTNVLQRALEGHSVESVVRVGAEGPRTVLQGERPVEVAAVRPIREAV